MQEDQARTSIYIALERITSTSGDCNYKAVCSTAKIIAGKDHTGRRNEERIMKQSKNFT